MIQKQSIPINFAAGLDTKTDPFQVTVDKFLSLENTVFTHGGQLDKRNGFPVLQATGTPVLPVSISTLNDSLIGITNTFGVRTYSENSMAWYGENTYFPAELNTLPLYRSSYEQTQCDAAIANGFVCTVFTDAAPPYIGGDGPTYKYQVSDVITGQNVIFPTPIPNATGPSRVFAMGNYFILLYTALISDTEHLQYLAINSTSPATGTNQGPTDISTDYVPSPGMSFDADVYNDSLYISWCASTSMKIAYLTKTLQLSSATTINSQSSVLTSVCVAPINSTPVAQITVFFYDGTYTWAWQLSATLVTAAYYHISSRTDVVNITGLIGGDNDTCYIEVSPNSGLGIYNNRIYAITNINATPFEIVYAFGVGLASKARFGSILTVYSSDFQSTYFLMSAGIGNIIAKFSYGNAAGYLQTGLPNNNFFQSYINTTGQSVIAGTSYIPYLANDFISSVNSTIGAHNSAAGIYSQAGVSLLTIIYVAENVFNLPATGNVSDFQAPTIVTAEVGESLHISGGFLWDFDGLNLVENNFFLYPDLGPSSLTGSTGSGSMTSGAYEYVALYSWVDNNGLVNYSGASIPASIVLTTDTWVQVIVPSLRLTYKPNLSVFIRIFRWSANQQVFYETTSVTSPLLNEPDQDIVVFYDFNNDSQIIGNSILYTTGGVAPDNSPPATNIMNLFDSRLWLVDAEDPNLLYLSKQVIENTPVECSDLLTMYLTPTLGAQGSTGPITALAPMDDKLVIFKKDAIYYLTGPGSGPDNTGANNQYTISFVASSVGTVLQNSIVLMKDGLMFQSDKGIWLLDRGLGTSYIGAPVEQFTSSATCVSSLTIPGTNQVRFTMDSGITLVYDYFYSQWSTFTGIPGISSTLYQGLHTFINSDGVIFQESPGTYSDGSAPVVMSFTTSWIKLAGLQGYQRAFFFYLLGVYISPHKLQVSVAYNYDSSPLQQSIIMPINFTPSFGGIGPYGQGSYGGVSNIEQWRIFLTKQRCQALQISVQEIYDPSFGIPAGQGLTLSGINLIAGFKSPFRTIPSNITIGG